MSRGTLANPRKMPLQACSKTTVDAIVTAAAHISIKYGDEGATIGCVGIGSLYSTSRTRNRWWRH